MSTASLSITLDTERLTRALQRAPKTLSKNINSALNRVVKTIARDARRAAPKATSQLTNSILTARPSALSGIIKTGTDYATAVELGSGPQALDNPTQRGGTPNIDDLEQWIRVKRIKPVQPDMDRRDLAFVIADSITAKGTPAQPFMRPALAKNQRAATTLLNNAIRKTLGELS